MFFVDSHTHLFLPEFENDRDEVIMRAMVNDVKYFFVPNIDIHSIKPVRDLCNKYPNNCFPLMGLHPGSVKEDFEKQLERIEAEISQNKVFGIGEVGLDFYWDETYKSEQINSFQKQIQLAIKYELPLIIHVRNSLNEVLTTLSKNYSPGLKGIFHCFTGSIEDANKIIDLGFSLGIGGILTFKNADLDHTVSQLSLENLVLETDSPYLAPVPYRGKRNESTYIPYIADKLAEIFRVDKEEIANITNENIQKIFSLKFEQ